MLIPDPRRTPLPNLISHGGIILYQWEFLRARLDEGEGLPWIAMDMAVRAHQHRHRPAPTPLADAQVTIDFSLTLIGSSWSILKAAHSYL